jgi:hypothetical protein
MSVKETPMSILLLYVKDDVVLVFEDNLVMVVHEYITNRAKKLYMVQSKLVIIGKPRGQEKLL